MRSVSLLLVSLGLQIVESLIESNIPIVVLRTATQMPTCCTDDCCASKSCQMAPCILIKEIEVNGTMTILTEGKLNGVREFYNATFSVHGQSTATVFPKQAYNVEAVGEFGQADDGISAEVLGFPKGDKFIFKAPYADQTLIHDALAFEMFNQMGRYASRTKLVEMYVAPMGTADYELDQWAHYKGVYVLEEAIRQGKNRVPVTKEPKVEPGVDHNPASTGWILSVDKHGPDDPVLKTTHGTNIQVSFPKIYNADKYSPSDTQSNEEFVLNFINEFEQALFSDKFIDPVEGYAPHIDLDSFVDFFIHSEMTTSVDAYRFSVYMSKDSCEANPTDCKLKMGPAWDYDLALGMCGNGYAADYWACNTEYFRYEYECRERENHLVDPTNFPDGQRPEGPNTAQWYKRMLGDPMFVDRVRYRYNQLREDHITDNWVTTRITEMATLLTSQGAAARNFNRWGTLGQNWVWPYRDAAQSIYRPQPTPKTFDDEIANLKKWLLARLEWLDGAMTRPFMHSYTALGTTCDVRGSYIESTVGNDCSPGCGSEQIDIITYPDCVRKVDECQRTFYALPPQDSDDGPYGSFRDAGVVKGSYCEFLHYIHAAKPDRCPDAPAGSLPPTLFCASGVCSDQAMPPTKQPTTPPTRAPPTNFDSSAPTSPGEGSLAPTTTVTVSPTQEGATNFPTSLPTQIIPTKPPTIADAQQTSSSGVSPVVIGLAVGGTVLLCVVLYLWSRARSRRAKVKLSKNLQADENMYVPPVITSVQGSAV